MNAPVVPCEVILKLPARTVAELMTPSPISIREDATLAEAIACLADRGISGAPVIDASGRPIGVLTEADLTVHLHERFASSGMGSDDPALVRDLMTPAVFTLRPESPAASAIEHMRALNVHRIFIVDEAGILLGVVTALDVLRRLELPE